jgi:hypothetical protein
VNEAKSARRMLLASRMLLTAAVLLFAVVGWRATRSTDAARDVLSVSQTADSGGVVPEHQSARADLSRLVSRDPFSPFRAAPDVAYQLGTTPADQPVVAQRQIVRLLGTIVRDGGRSFAMCQLAGQPVRMVYTGDRIGTLTLETVSQGGAVFMDDSGERVTLRVARTGE